jgi:hypothetical protein
MRTLVTIAAAVAALTLAACGGPDEPEKEREVMKVEDTAFGPLVTTPQKVEDRTGAAADLYRQNMNERLSEDEGAPREEPAED